VASLDGHWHLFEMTENEIATHIVDAAYKIHRALGPGLLESVYEAVMAHELGRRGLSVARQAPIAVIYDELEFDAGFRADLLVGGRVICELKAIEHVLPVHKKQLLTYVKLANLRLGLLINFGMLHIRDGITRLANGLPD